MKILMVCLGNICRSPMAEGILLKRCEEAGLDWVVDSAGTNGYHAGEPPHPLSQKVAGMHGIDISGQRARNITAADFDRFDLIYAMAEDVVYDMERLVRKAFQPDKVKLLMNEVHPGKNQEVPDPWYGPEPGYHIVYEMLDQACMAIIEKYGNSATH